MENEFSVYETKYFVTNSQIVKAIREKVNSDGISAKTSDAIDRLADQQSIFLEKLGSAPLSANDSNTTKLPSIIVPPFSGSYKDWPSFRDFFLGSVDTRKNLSPTHKFHYLKSYLRGDAANLIKHIAISDTNYPEAWDRLEKRYDRCQLIVQSFIQTFLSLPSASVSNVQTLRKISDGADEVVRGLSALNKSGRDPWLIYLLLNKLDSDSKQSWAEHIGSREDCTIIEFLEFLEERCDALEACQSLNNRSVTSRTKLSNSIRAHLAGPSDSASTSKCPMCQDSHILPQCSKFVGLDVESRRNFAKTNRLCFNCLRAGHSSKNCHSSFRCRVCKSRHHSLVHPVEINNSKSSSVSSNQLQLPLSNLATSNIPVINNHSLDLSCQKKTLLPTIWAKIEDVQGNFINCRVLLDSGSQSSFIVESFVQRLGVQRTHSKIPILGLSSTEIGYTKGRISLNIHSRCNSSHLFVDAFILDKLTSNLPSKSIDVSSWSYISNLELADPNFNIAAPIDILLGGDKLWTIIKGGQIRGPDGYPIAQSTSFGWVITGQFFEREESNHFLSCYSTIDIDNSMQRLWELEEVAPAIHSIVVDQAEEHFRQTFSRSPDLKYVVQLPFKTPNPSFENTLSLAVSRLHAMERRFNQNPKLRELYSNFMREYIDLGHMTRIPNDEIKVSNGRCFYLPHHAVLKPDSSSTKLRVVFDGSTKDSAGKSLNSTLLVGPPIQRDLIGVCLRFRRHPFVFTADVVKMFRQIWIEDPHADYQRIVWRDSPSKEIEHYRLHTVTYGTAPAPFLSVRVLKQLAKDYRSEYPNAARVLLEDVYVDDVMTGAKSTKELIELQSELVALLSMAKLQLRKWSSNSWSLLASLPKEDCVYAFFDTERSKSFVKVLGMHWNPSSDEYAFRMSKVLPTISLTRRSLLSEVSRIFDPLGLLAPSVVLFKILFQELWSSDLKLGWDDQLPLGLADRWASKNKGRSTEADFNPPFGAMWALLLVRLINLIKTSLSYKFSKTVAWCDSEIVLHWLSSPPRRWVTFVANRTAAILEVTPRSCWRHISSESNPADCSSRGVTPSNLPNHHLWWTGPSWLCLEENAWPKPKFVTLQQENNEILLEQRLSPHQVLQTSVKNFDVIDHIIKDIHKNNLHPGVSATFAIVRQQFWNLGCRNSIRKIVFNCKRCFKLRKSTTSQLMGDLPSQRISQSRPFSNTGCDYAGPFNIKLSKGRNPKTSKAYICLFVCMATKAIHLELVSDLTSEAFLAAFRRFVSRRGLCSNVYSDNGTNFQGARRCLNEMHKLVLSEAYNEDVATSLASHGTSSPHRHHTLAVFGRQVSSPSNFTFDE
ncbi:uncharacterized protein LOC129953729 [Eupeodes corollae]|uniref:uncharacterized protein LOC129953729 n=1 Tax=Eupeodes corollae TaxID=290404 RepID=UPI0024930841|nr:uncharacterized protein LOC129953729 [Eupeodes corollae]